MRVFLCRLLIALWFIPVMWTLGFAMFWLLSGYENALDAVKDLTRSVWNATV